MDMEYESKKFNTIITTRLVLCHAAVGPSPTLTQFMLSLLQDGLKVMQGVPGIESGGYPEPLELNWEMYYFNREEQCPLERISMAPWLVAGICSINQNDNYPLESIDPAVIIARARDVANKAVVSSLIADVLEIIDCLEAGATRFHNNHPEIEDEMRTALRIKGMAVDDHMATGNHQEYSYYAALNAS